MAAFLEWLRNSGNVRASCQASGVPRSTIYHWRNKFVTFRKLWDEAMDDACDILQAEAWKRAIDGESDRLLIFLLKAHKPEVYSERYQLEHTGQAQDGAIVVRFEGNIDPGKL